MKLNAIFTRKEPELNPKDCVIEHIEMMNGKSFDYFRKNLLQDHTFIEEHIDDMFHDKDGTLHAIVAVNEETGDGIIIDSSGSSYARYASFAPNILSHFKEEMKLICDRVLDEARTQNKREFDLEEISDQYGVPLIDGNGFIHLFATALNEKAEVCDIEYFDDGLIELSLSGDGSQFQGMEMK